MSISTFGRAPCHATSMETHSGNRGFGIARQEAEDDANRMAPIVQECP